MVGVMLPVFIESQVTSSSPTCYTHAAGLASKPCGTPWQYSYAPLGNVWPEDRRCLVPFDIPYSIRPRLSCLHQRFTHACQVGIARLYSDNSGICTALSDP